MARVTETFPGCGGIVRQVNLKTASREGVHRAVHQLVPLLPEEDDYASIDRQEPRTVNAESKRVQSRPRTRAVVKAPGGLLA